MRILSLVLVMVMLGVVCLQPVFAEPPGTTIKHVNYEKKTIRQMYSVTFKNAPWPKKLSSELDAPTQDVLRRRGVQGFRKIFIKSGLGGRKDLEQIAHAHASATMGFNVECHGLSMREETHRRRDNHEKMDGRHDWLPR